MYHEDRLGGGSSRASCCRVRRRAAPSGERLRRGLEERMGVRVEALDFRGAAAHARSHRGRRPSCSTRWRPPSASSFGSGSPDAAHEPFDPAVLQRARRARAARRWSCRHPRAGDRHGRSAASSTLSRYKTELNAAIRRDRNEIDQPDARGGADPPRPRTRRSWRSSPRAAQGGQRADRAAHLLVDRAVQPARGDAAGGRDADGRPPGVQGRHHARQHGRAGAARRGQSTRSGIGSRRPACSATSRGAPTNVTEEGCTRWR